MIEQLPEVQRLSDGEKYELMAELWQELVSPEVAEPDPEIVALLDRRFAAFKAGLEPASPWSEVKRRLGK